MTPFPFVNSLPEMVPIPQTLVGLPSDFHPELKPDRLTLLPEFRISKSFVTNAEFDRYVEGYAESPHILWGAEGPYKRTLVAWGKHSSTLLLEKDSEFLMTGKSLARSVLKISQSRFFRPPVLGTGMDWPAEYAAYCVFSDWAESRMQDPFTLLAALLGEMEDECGRFNVCPAVPKEKKLPSSRSEAAAFVSWFEAYGYARALGARLPTNWEEQAAVGHKAVEYTPSLRSLSWKLDQDDAETGPGLRTPPDSCAFRLAMDVKPA